MSDGESRARAVPFAAQVVAAFLRGNQLPASQLPNLIKQVHAALSGVDHDLEKPLKPRPFVPIRQSVTPSHWSASIAG